MKRGEIIFTIGYSGNTAIIDGKALMQHGSLDTAGLLEKGLYKQALASAYVSENPEEARLVLTEYNRAAGTSFDAPEQLERVFGLVRTVAEDVKPRILR